MEELIKKARRGDEEAFKELFLEIHKELYKIAKTRLAMEEDIQDAIQETMIEVYRNINKLRDYYKAKGWIIKILINKCNRIYRKKYSRDSLVDEHELEKCATFDLNTKIDADLNFYSLIQNLKYEERIILILYYMEEYNVKEISKILKINENTVTTKLYRGRQKVKENIMGGKKV